MEWPERRAKKTLRLFLKDTSVGFDMKADFRRAYERVVTIQRAIRFSRTVRGDRLMLLTRFFEHERNILIKHYTERSKKVKKLRATLTNLKELQPYS